MARKPNYAFERNKRAKAKAAKREAKRQAKLAARAEKAGTKPAEGTDDDSPAEAGAAEDGSASRTDEVAPPESI